MDAHVQYPDVIVVHLGGNDFGRMGTLDLLEEESTED